MLCPFVCVRQLLEFVRELVLNSREEERRAGDSLL